MRRVPVPFVFERVAVAATGPTMALGVASRDALPLTVATLTASGGAGALRFEVGADVREAVAVSEAGVLMATSFLGSGERATVSIVARDATPVNAATVAVTLVYFDALSLDMAPAEEFVFSPNFMGPVLTLRAGGGFGEYAYSRVEGNSAFEVGTDGIVSVVAPLPTGGGGNRAVFAVTDEGRGVARFTLDLEVRAGVGRPEEALFVVGGMDGSGAVSDVWRSTDGRHWQRLAAAAFTAREGLQVAAVGGTLWMAGGGRFRGGCGMMFGGRRMGWIGRR